MRFFYAEFKRDKHGDFRGILYAKFIGDKDGDFRGYFVC